MSSTPHRRPHSLSELEFERRTPVRWFSPPVLARAGAKVVLSSALGDYLDKREMQQMLGRSIVNAPCQADEVWVDFVADTGDGFDPTYTVAWCTSQPHLRPEGAERDLPRADVVVFGGDEVYPYANPKEYEDRFVGPFRSALPWTDPDPARPLPHPLLLAIPGNHDWYDGLTGFMRVFAQGRWVGGRCTVQTRSYFAVDLPGPYWLWGIDIQNGAYLDVAQRDYFRAAAEEMDADDRLILCTAKPSWADLGEDPDAYRNLSFVERELVPPDVTTVLMISGDKHHYARHQQAEPPKGSLPTMKVTAGGGGAFLSGTQQLDRRIEVPKLEHDSVAVPLDEDGVPPAGPPHTEEFTLECRYPSADRSRSLSLRALALGWFNWSFLLVPGVFHVLMFAGSGSAPRSDDLDAVAERWNYGDLLLGPLRSPATVVLLLVLWALLAAFVDIPKRVRGVTASGRRIVVGLAHTGAHLAVHAGVAWLAIAACSALPGWWFVVVTTVVVAVLGAVAGSVTVGAYLVLSLTLAGRHETEVFSSFRHEGYKNFLRLHVTPTGVTVHPIGIEEVCRDWRLDPAAGREASYLSPTRPIRTHLIEAPFTVR